MQLSQREAHAERGVALVLVLWMLSLLTVIATQLSFSTRTELRALANANRQLRAELAADAAFHATAHALLLAPQGDAATTSLLAADGRTHNWRYDDFDIAVTVLDESGRVDLNTANPQLLKAVFALGGLDAEAAMALTDTVLDWRDPDSLRRPHGAEAEDYSRAGRGEQIADSDFIAVEELASVLGIDAQLTRRIAPFLTVHSGLGGVNPRFASPELLLGLPGASRELVDRYVEQRAAAIAEGLPLPPFGPAPELQESTNAKALTIRIEVLLDDNARFRRETVVQLQAIGESPYRILATRHIGNPQDNPTTIR